MRGFGEGMDRIIDIFNGQTAFLRVFSYNGDFLGLNLYIIIPQAESLLVCLAWVIFLVIIKSSVKFI